MTRNYALEINLGIRRRRDTDGVSYGIDVVAAVRCVVRDLNGLFGGGCGRARNRQLVRVKHQTSRKSIIVEEVRHLGVLVHSSSCRYRQIHRQLHTHRALYVCRLGNQRKDSFFFVLFHFRFRSVRIISIPQHYTQARDCDHRIKICRWIIDRSGLIIQIPQDDRLAIRLCFSVVLWYNSDLCFRRGLTRLYHEGTRL